MPLLRPLKTLRLALPNSRFLHIIFDSVHSLPCLTLTQVNNFFDLIKTTFRPLVLCCFVSHMVNIILTYYKYEWHILVTWFLEQNYQKRLCFMFLFFSQLWNGLAPLNKQFEIVLEIRCSWKNYLIKTRNEWW